MKTSKKIASGIIAELARQGKRKGDLADVWDVTAQSVYAKLSRGDLTTDEVDKAAAFLGLSFVELVASAIKAPTPRLSSVDAGQHPDKVGVAA